MRQGRKQQDRFKSPFREVFEIRFHSRIRLAYRLTGKFSIIKSPHLILYISNVVGQLRFTCKRRQRHTLQISHGGSLLFAVNLTVRSSEQLVGNSISLL